MGEGTAPAAAGREIEQRHAHGSPAEATARERLIAVIEAVLLAVVTLLAAWSGFASAKWSTQSSLALARASAYRTEANQSDMTALTQRNFDASTFNAWFTAYTLGNQEAMRLAVKRFSPQFLVAFNSWLATDPMTNPKAPKGPTYMKDYVEPGLAESNRLDKMADVEYSNGSTAATNSDNYIRTTVLLASVLFLVGISAHFRIRGARIAVISIGGAVLCFAAVTLALAPLPSL